MWVSCLMFLGFGGRFQFLNVFVVFHPEGPWGSGVRVVPVFNMWWVALHHAWCVRQLFGACVEVACVWLCKILNGCGNCVAALLT